MRGSIENMHIDVGVSMLNDKDSKQEVLIKKKINLNKLPEHLRPSPW